MSTDGARGEPASTGDDFVSLIGLRVTDRSESEVRYELDVEPRLMNPYGTLHGGVVYSLADTSMGGALEGALGENELTATIEIKINYLAPVRDGTVHCITRILKRGKRIATLESDVYNGDRMVAKALGSFAIFEVQ